MRHVEDADRLRPRRHRAVLVATGVVTLLVGAVALPAPASPSAVTVTPTVTPTFATWTGATSDTASGTVGTSGFEVAFAGPDLPLPGWGPGIGSGDLSDPASYDPPGSASEQILDYAQRPGAVTITFDGPVTNLALYTVGFRGSFGPTSYRLDATGTGGWVRISGGGELAGPILLSGSTGFVNGVFAFAGTLTALEISTIGEFPCCGSQGFTLATLDSVAYPLPTVTGVSPTSGPIDGGTSVAVTGSGFFDGIEVTVGGGACTEVTVTGETQLTCVTPPRAVGTVDVEVTTPGGSSTLISAFTYVEGPGPDADPTPVVPTFTG
jgi:hypothetical protein